MKEIIYNITQQTEGRKVAIIGVNEPVNKNNVLGIINKTQSKVLYTPLQYANLISSEWSLLDGGTLTLTLADNVQIINVGDILFVKLYLDKDIDLSSVESKVEEVGNKIDNIQLPEVDTTELAKQGENKEATNTAIYEAVKNIPDLSLLYAARAEKNDDGVNTYSIVLPVTAKVTYDNNGVATIQL